MSYAFDNIWRQNVYRGTPIVHVVHQNGLHPVAVHRCNCNNDKDYLLYLDCGLFPASTEKVKTAFTFSCLDDYLIENLECKIATLTYWSKLVRLTNTIFPTDVPVTTFYCPMKGH